MKHDGIDLDQRFRTGDKASRGRALGGARAPPGSFHSGARASCPLRRNAVDPAGLRFRNCAAANPCARHFVDPSRPRVAEHRDHRLLFSRPLRGSVRPRSPTTAVTDLRLLLDTGSRFPATGRRFRLSSAACNSSFGGDDNLALADVAGGSRHSGHGTNQREVGRILEGRIAPN